MGLVSPHRTERPWLGRVEKAAPPSELQYDPGCYLCPGNERADGARNPRYTNTFVFDNDYPALLPDERGSESESKRDFDSRRKRSEGFVAWDVFRRGMIWRSLACRPGKFVPWWTCGVSSSLALEKVDWVRHVQIFENRGVLMGASNPHPHCQIWAERRDCRTFPPGTNSFQVEYRRKQEILLLVRLLAARIAPQRTHGVPERGVRGGRAVLGGVAIRNAGFE